jgi:adenosylmethionine-8-amino-7-oxononanoate aminotransferase
MKDYEQFKPLPVAKAKGSYIYLPNGTRIIDAISSWWCKTLGHQHPRLKRALKHQLEYFEHVILANTTHELIVQLSEKLLDLVPGCQKIFYASDGSSAVEIAMKMSLHARKILNETKKTKFIALQNAYHGETFASMSVSDLGIYRDAYQSLLFDTHFIQDIPYVNSIHDPLWANCQNHWEMIEEKLLPHAETATAIIFEPILQAASGMQMYSQDFLKRLCDFAKKNRIHIIADEIMTGFGRTGKMFAFEYADISPDFVCVAKGLTAGFLPMSAVMLRDEMYDLFYDDYESGKSFLHSHTHSGNALGAAVALEVFNIFQEEKIVDHVQALNKIMQEAFEDIQYNTQKIKNIRSIGAVVAADLCYDNTKRMGFEVYQNAVKLGALLRPIGNTIYWVPPLNISNHTLQKLKSITERAIDLSF